MNDWLSKVGDLPAKEIAGEVNRLLGDSRPLVITAPPGAGKSTLLPLTILSATSGKILMLEPRRIAARQIAERMAWTLGEPVGKTVGYRIRFETKVSSQTRIEVLTEGILTRMLVADPTLDGVSVVIFDEFHERSLTCDLALALTRESRRIIRPDLKIVIMSATIDTDSICKSLDANKIESGGRMFPVEIVHSQKEADSENAAEAVGHTIRLAHKEHDGDILAFLPGEADIRRCMEGLGTSLGDTKLFPLYGNLSSQEQRAAIAPSAPGARKVVLATPIAETSLTIEGVRIVVDSGLCRKLVFDSRNSLSRLETVRISMDMANQRSGRAGRVAPGVCYRLWSLATEKSMDDCRIPEILDADLSPVTLDIAAWGENSPEKLPWLTPPPKAHLAQAARLLESLGAIDASGNITGHGRKLASLPCHPRVSQMLIKAADPLQKALAADIAAVLEEKDPIPDAGTDITIRISRLRAARRSSSKGWSRIEKVAEQYRSLVKVAEDNSEPDPWVVGALLAAAYPERIGKAFSDGVGRYLLASGETAFVGNSDEVSAHEWIVAAEMNARQGSDGRIFLAAPVDPKDLRSIAVALDNVGWDSRNGEIVAAREEKIGKLTLSSRALSDVPSEKIEAAICEAARKEGLSMLDFSDEVGALQRRVAAVALWHPEMELPDLSTATVLGRASEWLPFYIGKARSITDLKKIDLCQALWGMLTYDQQTQVERLAPTHIQVPTGSRIRIEYRSGASAPVLKVRLQECFGLLDTPCVDGGKRPVLMELLSPGYKPVQLTQDLRSFWEGTYFEVRKELRRRYPKHSWPDNPLEAEAVRGVKKKIQ